MMKKKKEETWIDRLSSSFCVRVNKTLTCVSLSLPLWQTPPLAAGPAAAAAIGVIQCQIKRCADLGSVIVAGSVTKSSIGPRKLKASQPHSSPLPAIDSITVNAKFRPSLRFIVLDCEQIMIT